MGTSQKQGLSRRELMKRGLRAGAYAAPMVLASVIVAPVAAQTVSRPSTVVPTATVVPIPVITQPVPFVQDFTLIGAPPNTAFSIFFRPSNSTVFTAAGTLTTDARGVGGIVFPVTLDTSVVTSVQVVATVPGQPPSTIPTNNAASFTSTIIQVLAGVNGAPRPPALLVGQVIQEQTSAAVGGVANFTDLVDVGIFNGAANTSFSIFLQPNGIGTPIPVRTVTTNVAGNTAVVVPVTLTGVTAATSFTLTAVLAGTVVFTRTVTGTNVTNIPFMAQMPAAGPATYNAQGYGLQP